MSVEGYAVARERDEDVILLARHLLRLDAIGRYDTYPRGMVSTMRWKR
ncbi:MAG: hypothetical protein IPP82_09505 [Xanthomonadales bacterium]|nr:hypothetical protein [Xanthomonadales bacterium]